MAHTLTYSTELMDNYLSAEVVSPQQKFNALQTADGHALLFSISTEGRFYVFAQLPGHATGWERYDLASGLFDHFEKKKIKVQAKTFAVAENIATGKIDLALALTLNGSDHLYLSLGNDNTTGAIVPGNVEWKEMSYDDPDHKGITLDITSLYISERSREEYIVADISRSTFKKPSGFINRYHIDPTRSTGRGWNNMVVGGDLEPGINSVLGRMHYERVDGTYNLGKINGKTELIYAPLYNPFSRSAPPTISTFKVPKGATAIDTAFVGKNTALFVAGDKALYYYAADKQENGASGSLVMRSDFFVGVTKLFAYATTDTFIVWGINRANQVFYTTCAISQVYDSSAWSTPLPLISGVDQVSPYVNKADNGNVFFAAAGDELFKMVQSPETTIWKKSHVQLDTEQAKTRKFNSYTTRIQLADEQGQMLAGQELYLSTTTRTPFYINHLYYVLDKTPIPVQTDVQGSVTLIEMVHDINGAEIIVSEKGGKQLTITPSEKPFQKAVSLDSKDKLKGAQVEKPDGSKEALVTDHSKLDQLAEANQALAKAHKQVTGTTTQKTETKNDEKTGKAVAIVRAGDLFGFLDTGVGHTLAVQHDPATSVWKAVVAIGDWVYHAVLDTVDAIYSALKWVYHAIGVDKLLEFLSFFFDWDDIKRTKKVYKNMIMCFLKHEIAHIGTYRKEFDSKVNGMLDKLDGWAGITDDFRIGNEDKASPAAHSSPQGHDSAPGNMLMHHYNNNGRHTKELEKTDSNPVEGIFKALITALENEGKVFEDTLLQLYKLAPEVPGMPILDLVKRIVGIVAGDLIKSAQILIDAFLDILENVADLLLRIMDTKIHIPVVSDILELIGIKDFSIMDVFCYIAAVPATLAYKGRYKKAPFPNDKYTRFLINAPDYNTIRKAFANSIPGSGIQDITSTHTSSSLDALWSGGHMASLSSAGFTSVNTSARTIVGMADSSSEYDDGIITMPVSMAYSIYVTGYMISGFCSFILAAVSSFEAMEPEPDNPYSKVNMVLSGLLVSGSGIAAVLVPRCDIKNEAIKWVHRSLIVCKAMVKGVFSGLGQTTVTKLKLTKLQVDDRRAVGAVVGSVISMLSMTCSIWHFVELSSAEESNDKTAAILEETTNLVDDVKNLCYAIAVNDPEPTTKTVAIGVMATACVVNFGLYTAVASVEGI
ncbi:hypothetical protein AB9P05_17240 [Roseivirga sp. BDSF3-8]|uniref:hypothetical protein n=1 Tax=Roseivirga sp. BDSF3-8 TaxID=3241598 RepID=UPI003532414E